MYGHKAIIAIVFFASSLVCTNSIAAKAITNAASVVPGVTITTPVDGAVVRPGESVTLRVNVDSSLSPSSLLVSNRSGARIGIAELTTPPYKTTLTVPMNWAGPIEITVNVKTTNDDIVGPSSVFINVVPQETPTRIRLSSTSKTLRADASDFIGERTLRLRGDYANNIERDISHPSLGTTYTSSNPAVVTVSPEGILTPVAQGRAFITASFKGLKAYTRVTVGDQMAVAAIPVDHTSEVTITGGGFLLDRATGQFVQQVNLKNNSALPFSRPLSFVLAGLPSGVWLVDKSDVTKKLTPLDSPYVDISYASGATFKGEYCCPVRASRFS